MILVADVADEKAVEAAAEKLEQEFGAIDIWINNAMASVFSPIIEMKPEEFRRVTEVTYLGYVWGTLAALRRMRPRNRGVIVQVGSALAYRGIPLQSAYCAAKHAIQGFTDSLRCELIHDKKNIHVCDRGNAGSQHAAIRVGKKSFAEQGAAGAADFSTGSRGTMRLFSPRRTSAGKFMSACRRSRRLSE